MHPVPGPLQVAQHDQLHEVAEVQRGGGRVEPAVRRDRPVGECLAQRGLVGGLRHQATPLQLVEDVAHGGSVPFGWSDAVRAQPALPPWRGGRRGFARAVRRDGGLAVQPEPPRVCRRVAAGAADPDPRARADHAPGDRPLGRGHDGRPGRRPRVTSRPFCSPARPSACGQPGRAARQVAVEPPRRDGARASSWPADHLAGAQQDRAGGALAARRRGWRTSACRR